MSRGKNGMIGVIALAASLALAPFAGAADRQTIYDLSGPGPGRIYFVYPGPDSTRVYNCNPGESQVTIGRQLPGGNQMVIQGPGRRDSFAAGLAVDGNEGGEDE